jgi:signal transduction histidine kinase
LRTLIEEAWAQLSPEREGRDAVLRIKPSEIDLRCEVDRYAVIGALRNILDNSLDASPDPVLIDIEFSQADVDNRPGLRLSVRDHGDGLSAEAVGRAADAFFTTKTRGTGLGLAIVKRMTEAHGGRFSIAPVAAPEERGAVAIILLPKVRS